LDFHVIGARKHNETAVEERRFDETAAGYRGLKLQKPGN
jgi:hypothetical protein